MCEKKIKDDGKILWMDKDDFEKIVLSIMNLATAAAIIYRYVFFGMIAVDIVYLMGLFLTAFITRKGLSYWKPERYKKQKLEEKEFQLVQQEEESYEDEIIEEDNSI